MTSISAVNQNNQQIYTTSEKKESASIFNNPQAMESNSTTAQSVNGYSSNATVEDVYNQYLDEIVENYNGAKKEDIIKILDKLGYSKEKVIAMGKNAFYDAMPRLGDIFEHFYETDGDFNKKLENVMKLASYNKNDIEELSNYAESANNETPLRQIYRIAKDGNLEIDDKLREKLANAKSLDDLSRDYIQQILMVLVRDEKFISKANAKENQEFFEYFFLNIPDEYINGAENFQIRELLIQAMETAGKDKGFVTGTVFIAMFDKLKNCPEGVEAATSPEMLDGLFKTLETSGGSSNFFHLVQGVLDNGNVDDSQKSIFANKIADYVNPKLQYINQLQEKSEQELAPEEKAFLENSKQLKTIMDASGYALIRADESFGKKVAETLKNAKASIKEYASVAAYNYSLKDKNVNPVDVTTKLDGYFDGEYSKILTELGYELPTSDNIDSLREQAEQGVFDNKIKEYYASEQNTSGIGYQQDSKTLYENASYNAETLRSQILGSTTNEDNDYTVEKVKPETDNNSAEPTSFNKTNLSNYTGNELAGFISNGLMKFSDAVKQYSNHLSESGKRFVVQSIKVMDDGRQVFALNSTSNTARWEIMKKAGLLDEDLNVDFDFNHEKLREKYQG